MDPTCRLYLGLPAMRAASGRCAWPLAAAAALLLSAAARGADDFPPPIRPASEQATPAKAAEARPPGEAAGPAAAADEPASPQPAAPKPQADVQIEQKRVGRRVAEVIVTPAGFTYHYTMTHLLDQDPAASPLQPHQDLSVPRFFRFDFDF